MQHDAMRRARVAVGARARGLGRDVGRRIERASARGAKRPR